MPEKRTEQRRFTNMMFTVAWQDGRGQTRTVRARGMNLSKVGMCVESPEEIRLGATVRVHAERHSTKGTAIVRNCARRGPVYVIGLEFTEDTKRIIHLPVTDAVDYYEVLQVSPNAEPETIHRVYRIMAHRLHPDNPATGDNERFLLLNEAYDTLADPIKRNRYDAARGERDSEPLPIFESKEFVDGIEGEKNRRLGVLCLLYNQRRSNMDHPGLSILDLERLMYFPREYLTFTVWYLRDKGHLTVGDSSDCVLTADGVDYVENNCSRHAILQRLLTGGTMRENPAENPAESAA